MSVCIYLVISVVFHKSIVRPRWETSVMQIVVVSRAKDFQIDSVAIFFLID